MSSNPSLTLAEGVEVEFQAFTAGQPELGIQVRISVIYPDKEVVEFVTGQDGHAVRELKACDYRVKIEARSYWGGHTKKSSTCDPVPVKLAMTPTVQSAVVSGVLYDLENGTSPTNAIARTYFEALRTAVAEDNVSAAAKAANELQWSLYVAGDTQEAYNYGVFAQSAGFEALNYSGFAATIPEEDLSAMAMTVDETRSLVVMSETGQSILQKAQTELGLSASGAWDGQTFRALEKATLGGAVEQMF
jgi:hypothetical protein